MARCRVGGLTTSQRLWAAQVLALLVASHATAQPLPVGAAVAPPSADLASNAWAARLGPFLQAVVNEHRYVGGVALVLHQGKLVWQQAVGHEDLARERPMRNDALFRIYSMSKPIACVAALQLVAQGRLQLDDPVALHLPAFAHLRVWAGGSAHTPVLRAPLRKMTVRHLLTHTAGFATGGADIEAPSARLNAAQLEQSADLADYAARAATVPLAADPGQRFRYDGVNTEVLGRVLEVVAGKPLHDLLQQQVLNPLGMVDTGFEVPPAQRGRVVELTQLSARGELAGAPRHNGTQAGRRLRPYDSGAGGLYATAQDYGRFCQMLLQDGTAQGGTVLPPAMVQLMTQNQLAQTDPARPLPATQFRPGDGFGLGGSVVLDSHASASGLPADSFGWTGAASTAFSLHGPRQLCAVLLLQHLPSDRAGELPKLHAAFFRRVHDTWAELQTSATGAPSSTAASPATSPATSPAAPSATPPAQKALP